MFNSDMFDKWLDKKSGEIVEKLGDGKEIKSEEMIILVLKAQTNHFQHLDSDLKEEISLIHKKLEQTDRKLDNFDKKLEQTDKKIEQTNKKLELMQQDMDKRFTIMQEDMDKRFAIMKEDMDRRFEENNKQLSITTNRVDRFMFWSLGLITASTFLIIKFLS